jgi:hypothetical protein
MDFRPLVKKKGVKRQGESIISRQGSHFQYATWATDENGGRKPQQLAVRSSERHEPKLIHTCYRNPSVGTETLYGIAFDLDYDKASPEWKIKGRLNWKGMREHLLSQGFSPVINAITSVVTSSSERGLGVVISVSPFELIDENRTQKRIALQIQHNVIQMFNAFGMGADTGAVGLARYTPNFFQRNSIERNEIQFQRVNKLRPPIMSELLSFFNSHPIFQYKRKKDDDSLLYPYKSVEKKLAKLYCKLFNEPGDHYVNPHELERDYSLSRNTVFKILKNGLTWLEIKHISASEGYRLSLKRHDLYCRAEFLCNDSKEHNAIPSSLPAPELVEKGSRNTYIWQSAVKLKQQGASQEEATNLIGELVSRIPRMEDSVSCRRFSKTVASIYRNQPVNSFKYSNLNTTPNWCINIFKERGIMNAVATRELISGVPDLFPNQTGDLAFGQTGSSRAAPSFEARSRHGAPVWRASDPLGSLVKAEGRLLSRYSAREISEHLWCVHEASKGYRGLAKDFVPKGHPMRRLTTAFLRCSYPLRGRLLEGLGADAIEAVEGHFDASG